MSILTSPTLLSTIYGINMRSTGQTTLYTVPDGLHTIITQIYIIVTDANAITVVPSISIGSDGSWANWLGATSLTNLDALGEYAALGEPSAIAVRNVFAPSDVIKMDVRSGATATTFTASIQVFGFLFPIS